MDQCVYEYDFKTDLFVILIKILSTLFLNFRPGDCIEDTTLPLCVNVPTCSVFASKKQLTKCNKVSDYLHAKFYCVPSIIHIISIF